MSRSRFAFVLALVGLLAAATPVQASPPAGPSDRPVPGPRARVVKATDQVARVTAAGLRAATTANQVAPFLTRPYWNFHSVTSIFDHCNPDYSHDGRICEEDGTVAVSSNGVDPTFTAGYAMTPGGRDYLYYDGHNGWDIGLNYETLLAAADGTVNLAGCDPNNGGCNAGFGLTVTIDHPNGLTTRYGHMSQIYVSHGQNVQRGQEIGVSGNTGASTGPHLHFGVYLTAQWIAIDPWGWEGNYADPWPSDVGNLWFTGNPQNPVPWAPTGVTATQGFGSASVSWTPPAFDGGSGIASYVVTASPGGASTTVAGTATSAVVSGLANGTSYTFTVVATNAIGSSPASAPSNAVVPTGVTFGALPSPSNRTDFDVSWTGPAGATYDVGVSEDGGPFVPWQAGITATTVHFYGLAGHSYRFQVTAHAAGSGGTTVSPAVPVAAGATRPFPFSSSYTLDGFGGVHALASQPLAAMGARWNWDIGRALALTPAADGGLVLDGWGGLSPVGNVGAVTGAAYWSGWDIARDVAILPDGSGGYVLDGWGALHPFALGGHALPPNPVLSGYWPGWDIARRLVLLPDGSGGYVLDGWGAVHPFGLPGHPMPATPAVTGYWSGWDIARAITLNPGGPGGYVLDGWGGIHPFGGAPVVALTYYAAGNDASRGLIAGSGLSSPGGYEVNSGGDAARYGSAPALPAPALPAGSPPVVSAASR